jgi:hypothetical protein
MATENVTEPEQPDDVEWEPHWEALTSGMAGAVADAAHLMDDDYAELLEDPDYAELLDWLPPMARRRALTDQVWLLRLIRSGVDLLGEIVAHEWPTPRCTAEAIMLRAAIINGFSGRHGDHEAALVHNELLFEDDDIGMLWMPEFDGIENDTELLASLRTGDDLQLDNWWTWFGSAEPRR